MKGSASGAVLPATARDEDWEPVLPRVSTPKWKAFFYDNMIKHSKDAPTYKGPIVAGAAGDNRNERLEPIVREEVARRYATPPPRGFQRKRTAEELTQAFLNGIVRSEKGGSGGGTLGGIQHISLPAFQVSGLPTTRRYVAGWLGGNLEIPCLENGADGRLLPRRAAVHRHCLPHVRP